MIMKKMIIAVLVAIMMFAFVACTTTHERSTTTTRVTDLNGNHYTIITERIDGEIISQETIYE